MNRAAAVELKSVNKSFGPVHANRDINLRVEQGSIHGIIGENGAGKSTLMNILYGFYEADSGSIAVFDKKLKMRGSEDAIKAGIGMVHQHFMLVEPFTALENILLGAEGGMLLKEGMAKARQTLLDLEKEYQLEVDIDTRVRDLPVGVQQRIEILKALYREAQILILDEPTGVLTPQEADHLFRILAGLRDQGRTIILITHKLREIMAITDEVSVMRQGAIVAHRHTSSTSTEELAELMVGRKVQTRIDKKDVNPGETVLAVHQASYNDQAGVARLKNISLEVRAGEIVGIAGVAGNGQSELLGAIAGILPLHSGEIALNGSIINSHQYKPGQHTAQDGLGHVPEDRLKMGLVKGMSAFENAILGYHDDPHYSKNQLIDRHAIIKTCQRWMKTYDVRPQDPYLSATSFSGGNQQKLVLAREMEHEPDLLLVGQPTRGVDIGAIEFIHEQIVAMRDQGKAILLVSVELEEILKLADRIIVMFAGAISGCVDAKETSEQELGLLMAGIGNSQNDVRSFS